MRPAEHASRSLQARLEGALAGAAPKRTVIGQSVAGRRAYAAAGCSAAGAEAETFRTGCTTKLLVAALLGRRLDVHGLRFDTSVRRVLGIADAEPLGETTLAHLLEHTHGLDDSDVAAAPLTADGRIDAERLVALLRGRRFAAPGEIYSYSNAGAFILAAALEMQDGRPFAQQLREDLLAPLGMRGGREWPSAGRVASAARVCPATGGGLALTVGDLLTFLDASAVTLGPEPTTGAVSDPCRVMPLPGWHPLERGVRLGWKCYRRGWFGHQSMWPAASLLLCVRPSDGSATVVASEGLHAAVVAAKVLGSEMPALLPLALPKRMSAEAAARFDPRPYSARYALAAESLEVEAVAGALRLRSNRGPTRLIPATDEIFFLEDRAPGRSFVQFIDRDGDAFRRLWDGRRVYPLAESSEPVSRRDARRSL